MSAALRLPSPEPRYAVRARLEAAIEQAIAALDALDGDPDFEAGDNDHQCEDEGWEPNSWFSAA